MSLIDLVQLGLEAVTLFLVLMLVNEMMPRRPKRRPTRPNVRKADLVP